MNATGPSVGGCEILQSQPFERHESQPPALAIGESSCGSSAVSAVVAQVQNLADVRKLWRSVGTQPRMLVAANNARRPRHAILRMYLMPIAGMLSVMPYGAAVPLLIVLLAGLSTMSIPFSDTVAAQGICLS